MQILSSRQKKATKRHFFDVFRAFIDGMGEQTSVKAGHLQISLPFQCVFNLLLSFWLENGVTRDCEHRV